MVYYKLQDLEDIMEKYGIESVEELDNLIKCCQTSSVLTEERIKEIAENEIRKTFQKNIQKIRETEYRVLLNELNTWQKACELACRHIAEVEWLSCPETDDIKESENEIKTLTKQSLNYFYQQAKNSGENK